MADNENIPLKSEDENKDKEVNDNNNQINDAPKQAKDDEEPQQQQQEQQQQQPGSETEKEKDFKDYAAEAGVACNKCYNWFPIGIFAWLGGWLLILCAIIDMFTTNISFTQFFVIAYLICGGLLILIVELPAIFLRKNKQKGFFRKLQLKIYEWLKLLQRMWGRAVLNFLLIIMCYSEMDGDKFRSLPWIAGIYLIVIMVLYVVFSKLAARKYNALFLYIQQTEINVNVDVNINVNISPSDDELKEPQNQSSKGGDDDDEELLTKKFKQKFAEIDRDNDGKVRSQDIAQLAIEADLELSNSEVHAIFTFLDEDCNGVIVELDWMRMWLKNRRILWL